MYFQDRLLFCTLCPTTPISAVYNVPLPYIDNNAPNKARATPYKAQKAPYTVQTIPYKARITPYKERTTPNQAQTIPYKARTMPYKARTTPYKESHGGITVRLSLSICRSFSERRRSSAETARIKGYFPTPQNFPEKSSSSMDQNMVPPSPLSGMIINVMKFIVRSHKNSH